MNGSQSLLRLGLLVALAAALCFSRHPGAAAPPQRPPAGRAAAGPDRVRLQLKWRHQAQFAGYYVAQDRGYFKERNLEVEMLPGGPDRAAPDQVLAGAAEIGVAWAGDVLARRDKNEPLVIVAQLFQRSAGRLISRKSAGIKTPRDLAGKRVGVWVGANELKFRALVDKYGLDNRIENNRDLTVIKQGFDMAPFLKGELDAASAQTYNEYNEVVESGVRPQDLNVIDYHAEGVGILEDNLFITEEMMRKNREVVIRFLAAAQKGWQDAVRDQPYAVEAVMKRADPSTTDRTHQVDMMAEVAKLVWPAGLPAERVGFMSPATFATTERIALRYGVIHKRPKNAYTNELVEAAAALNTGK
jgi:NitT/TauT family transport system substrate-binding protein